VIFTGGRGNSPSSTTAPDTRTSQQSPLPTSGPTVGPSTSDDWQAAVCKLGTITGPVEVLPGAYQSGSCYSPQGGAVFYGQYTSTFTWQNDVARLFSRGNCAVMPDTGGQIVFVTMWAGSKGQSVLQPLTQFGFDVDSCASLIH
jgi:hypothetical protein